MNDKKIWANRELVQTLLRWMEMNDVGNEWWMMHYLEKLEYKVPKSRPIEGKTKGPYGISSEVFKWSYLTNTILRVIKNS